MVEFCYDPTFCAHFLSIRKRSVSMRIRKNHLNGNLQEHGKVQWVSGIMDSLPRETWAILSGKQNWRWQATASNLTQHIWEQNIRPHLRSLANQKNRLQCITVHVICKTLENLFSPKPSVTVQRFKRNCLGGESVVEFVMEEHSMICYRIDSFADQQWSHLHVCVRYITVRMIIDPFLPH